MHKQDNFLLLYHTWRENGANKIVCLINITCLMILCFVIPFERKSFRRIRENFYYFYPQIHKNRPRLLDPFRFIIQTIFLVTFKQAPTKPENTTFYYIKRFFNKINKRFTKRFFNKANIITKAFGIKATQSNILDSKRKHISKILLAASLMCSIITVTQPFNVTYQFIFVGLMWSLAVILKNANNRISLMLMIFISVIISSRYIYWRVTKTVLVIDTTTVICAVLLLIAELYAYLVLLLSYFQVSWVLDRKPYPLPEDKSLWPSVDVFIPSYNEPLEVVKPCLLAALDIDWPKEKLNVYMLDDGSRVEFEKYCNLIGVKYIKRFEHNHAKAGNINHALTKTNGDIVAIFDCDHIPCRAFLQMTVGWMVHDPKIALVQTPHHFYSDDPFEKNLGIKDEVPAENSLFHDFIQKGNDTWNATMFCGSCAIIRRKPLEEIGGIAVETVTEDAHTSLRLNRKGYSSAFISMPLAAGLATESLADHINQRIRWARGMVQIFRIDNPFKGRGLTLAQRLCFANAMIHFLNGLPRIIFLLAPLAYLYFDIYIIFASGLAILSYVLPHIVHSTMTNQKIQGNKRFYFWGVVYETILSWYITVPTLVALFAPSHGKFNVTAKGASNEKTYFDWTVTKPYIIIILLNFFGLMFGIYKIIFDPYAEVSTILINIIWVSYNLLILGAAAAVALERRQVRSSPRVRCNMAAKVLINDKDMLPCTINDFSKDGLGISFKKIQVQNHYLSSLFTKGQDIKILIDNNGIIYTFNCKVRFINGVNIGLSVILNSLKENIEYVRCTFAVADRWSHSFENLKEDTLFEGIHSFIRLGINGYKKMLENVPHFFKEILWLMLKILSFAFSLLPEPIDVVSLKKAIRNKYIYNYESK